MPCGLVVWFASDLVSQSTDGSRQRKCADCAYVRSLGHLEFPSVVPSPPAFHSHLLPPSEYIRSTLVYTKLRNTASSSFQYINHLFETQKSGTLFMRFIAVLHGPLQYPFSMSIPRPPVCHDQRPQFIHRKLQLWLSLQGSYDIRSTKDSAIWPCGVIKPNTRQTYMTVLWASGFSFDRKAARISSNGISLKYHKLYALRC